MEEMRNVYRMLDNHKDGGILEDLDIKGKIILK
jgi:hypothetical protein